MTEATVEEPTVQYQEHLWEIIAKSERKEVLRCKKCGAMARRVVGGKVIYHLIEEKKQCLEVEKRKRKA